MAFYRMDTNTGGTYIIYDKIKGATYYANTQLNKYIEAILKNNYNVFNTRNKQGERAFYYITRDTELKNDDLYNYKGNSKQKRQ